MFNREELLMILKKVDDKNIIEKINSMLFVDKPLIDTIIDIFENKGLTMKYRKT